MTRCSQLAVAVEWSARERRSLVYCLLKTLNLDGLLMKPTISAIAVDRATSGVLVSLEILTLARPDNEYRRAHSTLHQGCEGGRSVLRSEWKMSARHHEVPRFMRGVLPCEC